MTMNIDSPSVSVIVPTHNRWKSLQRLLAALQTQSYPLPAVEVIVVADGCEDETVAMLQAYQAPFALHVIEQSGQGAATARNAGAARASGQVLLFLDDDIEPSPPLIQAHVAVHQAQENHVAIGYLPPVLQKQSSFFHINLWAWWEDKFQRMRQAGHRYAYDDLLSGNFSLPAQLFHQVGGFDTSLRCREDYELGARLIKADAQFIFTEAALGYHRDEVTDLNRSLHRKRLEGKADVQFGRRHPDLIAKLRISDFGEPPLLDWVLINLIFWIPIVMDQIALGLRFCLDVLERLKIRSYWYKISQRLHGYWYLRGISDELKTYKSLLSLLQGGFIPAVKLQDEIEIDLEQGLPVVEQNLDEQRPQGLRIRYGQKPLGYIPLEPGAERLRGAHLRPLLLTRLAWPLMQSLLAETPIQEPQKLEQLLAISSVN